MDDEDPSNAVVDGLVARALERGKPLVRWCIVCQRRVEMVADEHGATCSCCGGRYQDERLSRR